MTWQPCPPGAFNPTNGSNSSADCLLCAAGSENPSKGATKAAACGPCRAGTYSDVTGMPGCLDCPPGTFSAPGSTACTPCESGTYAANRGMGECVPCPFPLSSGPGSAGCAVCREGYYHGNTAKAEDILEQPDQYCPRCPLHAACPFNSSLNTLVVPPHFWRDSLITASLHRCNRDSAGASTCLGSNHSAYRADNASRYCFNGHTGPRCEHCTAPHHYFERGTGHCEECPTAWLVVVLLAAILGVVALLALLRRFAVRSKFLRPLTSRLSAAATSISLQAKFKIMVGFYQVR